MITAAASSAASSSAASSNRLLDAVRASDTATVRQLLHLEDDDDDLANTAATERPSSNSPPANPSVADSDGSSALHWAGWVKNRAIFLALLRAGADPAATNHRGESVLEWSLRGGDLSILSALLTLPDDAGEALLRSRNAHGGSCMHIAAEEGLLPAMAAFVLLRGGHDLLDARDARGKTPLMCAAHRSKPMAVQFLLRHGASASLRDNEQATALHYAALAGNEFACRELLLQGAQSAALAVRAFEQRQTPEELAEAYGHPHLASFLHRWKKQSNGVWKSAAQPQTTFMRWHNDAHMFARHFARRGLDLPQRKRQLFSGLQLYFFATIFPTLIHFALVVQPTLSSPVLSNLSEDPAYALLLQVLWISAASSVALVAGFQFSSPGFATRGAQLEAEQQASAAGQVHGHRRGFNDPLPAHSRPWLVAQSLGGTPVCVPCRIVKPIRSKHCSLCGGCVLRMDHHCGWLNSCVGVANHRLFMVLVVSMLVAAAVHAYLLFFYLFNFVLANVPDDRRQWTALGNCWVELLILLHTLLVLLGSIGLCIGQSYTLAQGITTNEAFNRWRYAYLANNKGNSPFSQGVVRNCLAFLGIMRGSAFVRDQASSGSFALGSKLAPTAAASEVAERSVLASMGGSSGGEVVVLNMDSDSSLARGGHAGTNGHGHSHGGGKQCHGHGHDDDHDNSSSVTMNGAAIASSSSFRNSPPAPNGSLNLQALLRPPHGQFDDAATALPAEQDPNCAFFAASDLPMGTAAHSRATTAAAVPAQDDVELEHVGLLSGTLKDKHR